MHVFRILEALCMWVYIFFQYLYIVLDMYI